MTGQLELPRRAHRAQEWFGAQRGCFWWKVRGEAPWSWGQLYNWSCSVKNSLLLWYRHSTTQSTTILKTFTCESENGLWCDVHFMLVFECRHVHPREHCTNVFPPRPRTCIPLRDAWHSSSLIQRSSVLCLSDVRAADESICGLGSAAFKDAWIM